MLITRKLFVLSAAIFLFGASAAFAGPTGRKDKGASNNGGAASFGDCSNPAFGINCEAFDSAPFETVDGTAITKFVINDGSGTATSVTTFAVFTTPGTVTPGSTLLLDLASATTGYGIFACDNGSNPAIAGGSDPLAGPFLTGPCTVGNLADLKLLVSESDPGNLPTQTLFTLNGGPSSWAFFTDPGGLLDLKFTPATGGTTSTPEPGSGSLLFAGALAAGLAVLKTRR
jgi:hypothetical protein